MAKIEDAYPGAVFGNLTVLSLRRKGMIWARCLCLCGVIKDIRLYAIGTNSTSCGCGRIAAVKKELAIRNTKHNMRHSQEYQSWANMWQRTTNKSNGSYPTYKDRAPPEEWRNFEVFLADMGPRPEGLTLERIDNSKPYGPGNCKWATKAEQALNKDTTYRIELDGKLYSLHSLAKHLGVKYGELNHRFVTKKEKLHAVLGIDESRLRIAHSPLKIFGQS